MTFDPAKVSYEKLLDVFWLNHDPTVTDRQFCDSGSQYRPEIFYHSEEQKRLAEASKAKWEKAEALPAAAPHADHRGERVLSGRGLPPGLLQEEPAAVPLLRHRAAGATRASISLWGALRKH